MGTVASVMKVFLLLVERDFLLLAIAKYRALLLPKDFLWLATHFQHWNTCRIWGLRCNGTETAVKL